MNTIGHKLRAQRENENQWNVQVVCAVQVLSINHTPHSPKSGKHEVWKQEKSADDPYLERAWDVFWECRWTYIYWYISLSNFVCHTMKWVVTRCGGLLLPSPGPWPVSMSAPSASKTIPAFLIAAPLSLLWLPHSALFRWLTIIC